MRAKYPSMSPYVAFNNNPIFFIDPLGLEGGPPAGLPSDPTHAQIATADDGKQYQFVVAKDGNGSWGYYSGDYEVTALKLPRVIASGSNTPGVGPDFGHSNLGENGLAKKLWPNGYSYTAGDGGNPAYLSLHSKGSDFDLFEKLYELGDDFADGSKAEAMVKGLIDHFKENTGTPYSSQYLTTAVNEHPSTSRFYTDISEAVQQEINENGGFKGDFNLKGKLIGHPRYNEFGYLFSGDEDNGLLFSVNDVWDYEIKVVSYDELQGYYNMELQITLYDHFGLDPGDITDHYYSDFYPYFYAWFALQWGRNYKPFITTVHLPSMHFIGTLPQ